MDVLAFSLIYVYGLTKASTCASPEGQTTRLALISKQTVALCAEGKSCVAGTRAKACWFVEQAASLENGGDLTLKIDDDISLLKLINTRVLSSIAIHVLLKIVNRCKLIPYTVRGIKT